MDMCYDGTLVMPSRYAVMDEDEMSYVEAGFYISSHIVEVTVDAIAIKAMSAVKSAKAAGTTFLAILVGQWNKFTNWLMSGGVAGIIIKILGSIAVASVGIAFGIAYYKGTGISVTLSKGVQYK